MKKPFKRDLTYDEVYDLLHYSPKTGELRWRKPVGSADIGDVAGQTIHNGYVIVKYRGSRYFAHRLAWLLMTKEFPDGEIDHKNGKTGDNRWSNLRLATRKQNSQNQKITRKTKSGVIGVDFHKKSNKYRARITVDRKSIYLGLYNTSDEALSAYLSAKRKYHEFNPRQRKA